MTMTKQEIFDKGMQGVLKQEAFAWDSCLSECSYIDKNGNKCMIGHLVDDSKAKEWDENSILHISKHLNIDTLFAVEIQSAHDKIAREMRCFQDSDGVPKWDRQVFLDGMKQFAIENGLEFDYE